MKYFLVMLVLCINFPDVYAQKDTAVTFGNNTFTLSAPPPNDTLEVTDLNTGELTLKIISPYRIPLEMNGKKIFADTSIISMQKKYGRQAYETSGWTVSGIREYLLSNLKSELLKLDDYDYYISLTNIVVDDSGRIVYFNSNGISDVFRWDRNGKVKHDIAPPVKNEIDAKINDLLSNAPQHAPSYVDGRPAISRIANMYPFAQPFHIQGHKITKM